RAYFHLPYRQTQGVVIAHANKIPNTPNYSTISRRINRMEIKINEKTFCVKWNFFRICILVDSMVFVI
ncbi:MAG: hypothetical protein WA667_03215, partial [Candidatus Nitrosopolaris sp.]